MAVLSSNHKIGLANALARRVAFGVAPIWLALCVLLFGGGPSLGAQLGGFNEYQVKAAFLLKFIPFVDWPEAALPEKQTPLVIGVLGDDPFKGSLEEIVRDEKVGSRPLRVVHFRGVEEIKDCHILFISSSENKRLGQILTRLKSRSILTVGDVDGFAQGGGMIRFLTEQNKVRFRINNEAAKAANLTISSKLLRLAEVLPAAKD